MRKSIAFSFILSIVLFFAIQTNAAWVGNDTPPCQCRGDNDFVIVEGSSNFLQSYSQIFILLNESELGTTVGFDFSKAENAINMALKKLIKAKECFLQYTQCIERSGISEESKSKLIGFDYYEITEKRDLNPCIMEKVSFYLSKGDVAGFFNKLVIDMEIMSLTLQKVKQIIQKNTIPDIEDLRTLYQKYSEVMQMGYYSSLVFKEIKN
jgi:hypothetical protein